MEKLQEIAQVLAQHGQLDLAKEVANLSLASKEAKVIPGVRVRELDTIDSVVNSLKALLADLNADWRATENQSQQRQDILHSILVDAEKAFDAAKWVSKRLNKLPF